jgi:hypothetical protein
VSEQLLHKYQIQNDDYRKEIASLSEKVNQHTQMLNGFLDQSKRLEELLTFLKDQSSVNQKIEERLEKIEAKISEFHQKHVSASSTMQKLLDDAAHRKEQVQDLNEALAKQGAVVMNLPYKHLFEELKRGIERCRADSVKDIAKIREELVVSPAQIISSNQDLLRKIESAQLDGSNAMSKVNNFDLQIRILEKKIESLGILLKKIEISQQV